MVRFESTDFAKNQCSNHQSLHDLKLHVHGEIVKVSILIVEPCSYPCFNFFGSCYVVFVLRRELSFLASLLPSNDPSAFLSTRACSLLLFELGLPPTYVES